MKIFTSTHKIVPAKRRKQAFFGVLLVLLTTSVSWAQNVAPLLSPIANATIAENNPAGQIVTTASASDADGDAITYSLTVTPSSFVGLFSIDPASGVITANTLDYEEIFAGTTTSPVSINLNVIASDGAATDNESFSLFVTNEDDIPYEIGEDTGNISLNGNTSIGQSFTTTDAGTLTQFQINVVTPPVGNTMTVQVWRNSDVNPTASFTGPGHVETDLVAEMQVEVSNAGVQTIVLPQSVALDAGTVYSVEMFGAGLFLRYSFPATYSRGRILWSNNLFGCCDLHFVATITNAVGAVSSVEPLDGTNIDGNKEFVDFVWDGDGDGKVGESDVNAKLFGKGENDLVFILYLQAPGQPLLEFTGISNEFFSVPLSDLKESTIYEWWVEIAENRGRSDVKRFLTPDVISVISGIQDPLFSSPMESYPNPFIEQVTVSFDLKEVRDVALEIYDVRGSKVKAFTEVRNLTEGSFVWDGRTGKGDMAESGLYLYRLILSRDGELDRVVNGQILKK